MRPLAAVCLVTAGAAAQTVIPDGLAAAEGGTYAWVPARYGPNRAQLGFDGTVIAGLGTGLYASIGLRPNGTAAIPAPAHTFDTTIHVSEGVVAPPAQIDRTSYSANSGTATVWKTVLASRPVAYPAVAPPGGGPAPFFMITLDTPFTYRSGNNLLVQFDSATTSGRKEAYDWYVDAEPFQTGGGSAIFRRSGAGCPPGAAFVGIGDRGHPGGSLAWYFDSGSAAALPGAGVVGGSDRLWGGVALPFDLTPLGAPGCEVGTEPTLTFFALTTTAGQLRVDLPLPPLASLGGQTLFVQTYVFDGGYNALGLRASPLGRFVLGSAPMPPGAVLLYTGSASSGLSIGDRPEGSFDDAIVLCLQ